MTAAEGRYATAYDGAQLAYVERGRAQDTTVVLLHSLGADAHIWDGCLAALESRHVVVPDTRGHGRSGPATAASIEQWVGDIHDVLESAGIGDVVLVGVSQGGIQALAYAAAHPARVQGLVVADSFAALTPAVAVAKIAALTEQAREHTMSEVADQYLLDTFLPPFPAGAEAVRTAIAGMDADSYLTAVQTCFSADVTDLLPDVKAPVLVLWGDRDAKTPRALSERIAADVPSGELHVVPDAGHLSNVDNPTRFSDELLRFLAETTPRKGRTRGEGVTTNG